MAHRSRPQSNISFILFVILVVTAYNYRADLLYALYALAAIITLVLIVKLLSKIRFRRYRVLATADIDTMDGLDFEQYVADLLRRRGFGHVSLTEQYDMGVDIVAEKGGVRWGIQVKRYSGLVKAEAVRQVVTALRFYNCDRAMVITNSTYSTVARQLADSNDCVLVDRTGLLELIS
jgi:HJR/Mrr/RecB family endonuclease